MSRTVIIAAALASLSFTAPAAADVSRSYSAHGPYGGSASASGSCAYGAGCSREWSRTTPGGATASRSVSGYPVDLGAPGVGVRPGVGVGAPGVGVRPGRGLNLGGPVNRVGPR